MDINTLCEGLDARGIPFQVEPVFLWSDLTGSRQRVHLLRPRREERLRSSGFWLTGGNGLAFLGLIAGPVYRIVDGGSPIEVAAELVVCCGSEPEAAHALPVSFQSRYAPQVCDLVLAYADCRFDRLDEAMRSTGHPEFPWAAFLSQARLLADRCTLDADRLDLYVAGTRAILRVPEHHGDRADHVTIAVEGGFPSVIEQRTLLRAIARAVPCTMYDAGWNNRIDWEDPYYAMPGNADADRPRNAMY